MTFNKETSLLCYVSSVQEVNNYIKSTYRKRYCVLATRRQILKMQHMPPTTIQTSQQIIVNAAFLRAVLKTN